MADGFSFSRRARNPRGIAIVAFAAATIAFLAVAVSAALWIIALLTLALLPALWDILRNSEARLDLDAQALSWSSGRRAQRVPLARIEQVILSTTLDFSQRARVRLDNGQTLRIPVECLPGGRRLDQELEARGLPHRRSLFSF